MMNETNVSEGALARILTLPELRRVIFNRCDVSGEALASTPGSTSLKFVECCETPLKEDAALFFARCTAIEELCLWHPSVNDVFVSRLHHQPTLRRLSLVDATVSDQCIAPLRQMPALEGVALPRKGVTDSAVEALQSARPALKVVHYGDR